MSDINQVCIIGRLTRDVELSYTQGNTPIGKFSIAVNGRKKDDPNDVSFFNITAWDKLADLCNKYLKKGSQVAINGSLKQSRFTDKQGNNRSTVDIIARDIQFVGSKGEATPEQNNNQANNQAHQQQAQQQRQSPKTSHNFKIPEKETVVDPFDNIDLNADDEEIPF